MPGLLSRFVDSLSNFRQDVLASNEEEVGQRKKFLYLSQGKGVTNLC